MTGHVIGKIRHRISEESFFFEFQQQKPSNRQYAFQTK